MTLLSKKFRRFFFCITFNFLCFGSLLTANDVIVELPRISGSIQLDGFSNEPVWQQIKPLPMTVYQPVFQGTPTEKTEIRIAYDDNYLYVSGRLYDSDPAGIRANSLYRDRYSGDDTFAIVLDVFNDNENALWFFTNPAGVRFDLAISNDAQSGGRGGRPPANSSWNTYWDVATVKNQEGWFVEMRIPFSSLGFQDKNGQVVMGLITYRYISRKNERHIYPAIPPDWRWGFLKPSLAQKVVLKGVRTRKPIYLTPYSLGGVNQVSELATSASAYNLQTRMTREMGLDVKYNITNNLTLDLTINTDFAQVEADEEQVNLTRFSLFFPEKRQFFQERAGIFEFRTGRADRLFHSRQIGLINRQPVRIIGGARLVGRLGNWDLGFINMQTARKEDNPSENFNVLRLRRNVFNQNSYAGTLITSRIGEDGSYNVAVGLDGIFRLFGDEYLIAQMAQTFDDEIMRNGLYNPINSGLFRLQWTRRRQQGFNYTTAITRSGVDYRPDMGFITRRDFTSLFNRLAYGWFTSDQSPLRQITPRLFSSVALRNSDATVESAFFAFSTNFEFKSGTNISLSTRLRYEDLREPLDFPEETYVPEGSYTFYSVEFNYNMTRGRLLRTDANVTWSTFYDGKRIDLRFNPTWNVSPHLELSANYSINFVRFPSRNQRFDAHLVSLRAQAALNTKISMNALLQFNSTADAIILNLRFRYYFREGNDLWIVYNHGINTDRNDSEVPLPFTDNRTVLLKYTYTFDL